MSDADKAKLQAAQDARAQQDKDKLRNRLRDLIQNSSNATELDVVMKMHAPTVILPTRFVYDA